MVAAVLVAVWLISMAIARRWAIARRRRGEPTLPYVALVIGVLWGLVPFLPAVTAGPPYEFESAVPLAIATFLFAAASTRVFLKWLNVD